MPLTLNVIAAPSRSRPMLAAADVLMDAQRARNAAGASGVVGFTEISNDGARAGVARADFGGFYMPNAADTPIGWTGAWKLATSGVDFGCGPVKGVAPARHSAWVILEQAGVRVGVIATHMTPGGWVAHPVGAQRRWRLLIRLRWRNHARRIARRARWLAGPGHCTAVVTIGDINRPGTLTLRGDTRASAPGLVYIGIRGNARPGVRTRWTQRADHKAHAVVLTINGGKA